MPQALTDLSLRSVKPPERGTAVLWDQAVKGLCLRVSAGGTKAFSLVYGEQRSRRAIGRYPTISLADARKAARTFLAARTLGKHDHPTLPFSDAVQLFLDQQQHLKIATKRDYERILKKRFQPRLKRYQLNEVQTHHVTELLDKLVDVPAERKYCFAVIRRFFKWARGRRLVSLSPLEGLEGPKPGKSRERVLTASELKRVWDASKEIGYPFGAIVRLLILTGQRKLEIGLLHSDYLGTKVISFPAELTKNGRPHTFPIGEMTQRELKQLSSCKDYLFVGKKDRKPFNSYSKAKERLDKTIVENWAKEIDDPDEKAKIKLVPWTLHDLRRTYATGLQALSVRMEVIESLLNHVSGRKAGIVGVYQRHDYMPEMRAAVALWESYLHKLLA
jgi:integrase